VPFLNTQAQVDRANELAAKHMKGELSVAELNEYLGLHLDLFSKAHESCYRRRRMWNVTEPLNLSKAEAIRFNEFANRQENAESLSIDELNEYLLLTVKFRRVLEWESIRLIDPEVAPSPPVREPELNDERFSLAPEPLPPAVAQAAPNPFPPLGTGRPDIAQPKLRRDITRHGYLDEEQWVELPADSHLHRPAVSSLPQTDSLPQTQRPAMAYEDDKIITVSGVKYLPVFWAARAAQASDRTIRRWIDKSVTFNGKSLQTYTSPATGELYISQKSVEHLEKRFVKWPSKKQAGRVVIGETKAHDGFFHLPAAAKIVGVSTVAMWKWANSGRVPSFSRPLEVVKCPISDQLYVRERDAREIAEARSSLGLKHGGVKAAGSQQPTLRTRSSTTKHN
jgi:hypothetical protein